MDWDSIHFLMVLMFLGLIAYFAYLMENPWTKFLVGIVIFFSFTGITGIYRSPNVKGIIVDSETERPIKGAAISASWQKIYSGPGGPGGGGTVKKMKIDAGNDGSFKIPAQYLINCVPFPFGQGGDFHAAIYAHGYNIAFINKRNVPRSDYIPLEKIYAPDRFAWNMRDLQNITDKQFMDDELRIHYKRFGNKRWNQRTQDEIAFIYEQAGDYARALKKFEELTADYPDDKSKYAKRMQDCRSRLYAAGVPLGAEGGTVDNRRYADDLSSSDVQVRRDAASMLIERPDKDSIFALVGALQDADIEVRMNAVAALGNIGEKRAFDALLTSLKDSNPIVRELSARYLGLSRDPLYVPALKAAADDKERNVQESITWSLKKISEAPVSR